MRSTYKQAVSKETQSLQGAQIFQEKDEQTSETSTNGLGALPEAQRQTWHVCGTVPGKYKLTVTASVVPSIRFFVKTGRFIGPVVFTTLQRILVKLGKFTKFGMTN